MVVSKSQAGRKRRTRGTNSYMDDYFQELRVVLATLRRLVEDKKRNILITFILVILTGLFFSVLFQEIIHASRKKINLKPDLLALDPMNRIGKSSLDREDAGNISKIYDVGHESEKNILESAEQKEYKDLVKGHPIEAMVPAIAEKDREVSAFLIGIAKKESNWGKYSPKKNGRDCYNYWGYRGGYNPTDSGYSCFDSPEQAVEEVGGRIERLIDQNVNTPERMIVWKCGSTCAGHDPLGVRKWISDVSLYYYKLNS